MKRSDTGQTLGWDVYPGRVLLETPVVTIKSGPVRCRRSGREKEFYLLDFPDWVNVVALTPAQEMILIRQFRYGSNRMEIEIPGGAVEKGESPLSAGCRELLEETGYQGSNARIIGRVCPNPAIQANACYTVLVEDAVRVADPCMDDMEDIECFLQPAKEVLASLDSGAIDHGLVLNALMFFGQSQACVSGQ